MNCRLVTMLALTILVCKDAAAARPRFSMTLGVSTDGGEYFGTVPSLIGTSRRLFPGESLQLSLTGQLRNADGSDLSNATLVSELTPCVLLGDLGSELSTPAAHSCESVSGVSWQITPCAGGWTLCADLKATAVSVPAGTYTVFVVLPDANVEQKLGAYAPGQLRSNAIHVDAGPATTSGI